MRLASNAVQAILSPLDGSMFVWQRCAREALWGKTDPSVQPQTADPLLLMSLMSGWAVHVQPNLNFQHPSLHP